MEAISVIMATNRIDAYLEEAVSSVFANDGLDIELVLVLDGIPTPTPKPQWMGDPRVNIVVRKQSEGLGAALNTGIRNAKHEVIARLDGDDNSLPERFTKQLKALNSSSKPILVGTKIVIIDENGDDVGAAKQVCGIDVRTKLLFQNVVPHSSYMLRKSSAISAGLYREDLQQMEDYDFLLRIALLGPISVLCEPLVQYRVHSAQMSKKAAWRANYITVVIGGRRLLAKLLGVSSVSVELRNIVWRTVQLARSFKIMRPRHLLWLKKS